MTDFAQRVEAEARRQQPRALARTLWLQTHLAAFLHACAEADLPVLVLKGAALAETVYPCLGLRDFRDLDVLARPSDTSRARAVLERLGYAVDTLHWQDLASGRDGQADFVLPTPAGPVMLELHTDFINNDLLHGQVGMDREGVWQRAHQTMLVGVPARTLGPEDQLLHLCLHLAGHHLAVPRSLWDIACVCAAQTVDWPLLTEIARKLRMTRMAYTGLFLAARLFDAAVPSAALAALAPRNRRLLERLALARAQDLDELPTAYLRLPLLLLLSDRPWRLPLLRLLFPSRRWLNDHYTATSPRNRYAAHLWALIHPPASGSPRSLP